LDRFRDMGGLDDLLLGEIGNRPGDLGGANAM